MLFKDGVAYLQAGGGIVFDSVEEDEYVETLNKLKGNLMALEAAEGIVSSLRRASRSLTSILQSIGTRSNKHSRIPQDHNSRFISITGVLVCGI